MKNIKTRILLAIFVLEVAGYSTLVLFNREASEEALTSVHEKHLVSTVEENLMRINSLTRVMEQSVLSLASAGEQFLLVQQENPSYNVRPVLLNYLSSHFRSLPEAIGGGLWYEPYIFQKDKRLVGPYVHQVNGEITSTWDLSTEEYDYLSQDWYLMGLPLNWDRSIRRPKPVYWTEPYLDDAGSNSLMVTVDAFIHNSDGHVVGLSTVDWSLDGVTALVGSIQVTPNSYAFLIDIGSRRFLHRHTTEAVVSTDDTPWVDALDLASVGDTLAMSPSVQAHGIQNRLYYARTDAGMIFGILVPEADFLLEVHEISRKNTVISIIISLVFVMSVFTLLLFLFRPFGKVLALLRASVRRDPTTGQLIVEQIKYNRDNEFRPIVDSFNDISDMFDDAFSKLRQESEERELVQKELRESQDQLMQAQKLEAVGRLAGGVAHDFNNIMTAILGYTQMALEDTPKNHPLHHDLTEIHKAGERAAALTKQLLAYSRKQVSDLQPVNMNDAINNISGMINQLSPDNIVIETDLQDPLDSVKLDAGQFEQILVNFIVNASDAMKAGGTITIATKNIYIEEISHGPSGKINPGHYVALTISDTGTGIPEYILEKIFDPFFTTKPVGEGTGLGLSTVIAIIENADGHIRVESILEQGTTFTSYFPRCSQSPLSLGDSSAFTTTQGTESILVVDDDPVVLEVSQRILVNSGYTVYPAENGVKALAILDENPDIQLLITDVVMPGLNGPALADKVREKRTDLRVLFISGYTAGVLNQVPEKQFYLAKPFTPAQLSLMVRQILDQDLDSDNLVTYK